VVALDWAQASLLLDAAELSALMDLEPLPDQLASEEYGESWPPGQRQASVVKIGRLSITWRASIGASTSATTRSAMSSVRDALSTSTID
jgi:hypothetical protein